ncbi:MAG: leucine-rich repeat domain-containing protein [Simkaniaceae bacterium]|nr:leucine-rich repeat domain-containing protein [Simkaniaceae bacterium]
MANPTELNVLSTLPAEAQQLILRYVGNPAVTSRVSKSWQEQTEAVVISELRQVFQLLNPGQSFNPNVNLAAIKEIYRQTLQSVPQNIALHLPRVSLEKFLEMERALKTPSTLVFWRNLPGGKDHVNQQAFAALPLTVIRERLSTWIEQNPSVKNIQFLDLSNKNLRYLPPEIGQLTNLWALHFPQNQITEIPPEIGLLTNLESLHIYQNPLTALPPEIGQLTNLSALALINTQITSLPDTLAGSKMGIRFSEEDPVRPCDTYWIPATLVYEFSQLSTEQKNTVYGRIYDLAKKDGEPIEPWDTEYGKYHVFDTRRRLEQAMNPPTGITTRCSMQ